jgi:uncharacterized membrane protein YdcZ (DUF606 family)
MLTTRRNLVGLAVLDVVLFIIANATAKSHSHPGTVSNIFWYAFLVGVVLLIVFVLVTVVQRLRRSPRTA